MDFWKRNPGFGFVACPNEVHLNTESKTCQRISPRHARRVGYFSFTDPRTNEPRRAAATKMPCRALHLLRENRRRAPKRAARPIQFFVGHPKTYTRVRGEKYLARRPKFTRDRKSN